MYQTITRRERGHTYRAAQRIIEARSCETRSVDTSQTHLVATAGDNCERNETQLDRVPRLVALIDPVVTPLR